MAESGVELDVSDLVADVRRLAAGIERIGSDAPSDVAARVAGELRSSLPRRSGRLASSVAVVESTGGAAVSYGSGVPYASYIDRRTDAVASAVSGADTAFVRDCQIRTEQEAGRI